MNTEKTSLENETQLSCLGAVMRSFIESEIKECERAKKNYGWICSHFRNYYEGRISAYEKMLLFMSVENYA
jgi:hypothetical protein